MIREISKIKSDDITVKHPDKRGVYIEQPLYVKWSYKVIQNKDTYNTISLEFDPIVDDVYVNLKEDADIWIENEKFCLGNFSLIVENDISSNIICVDSVVIDIVNNKIIIRFGGK